MTNMRYELEQKGDKTERKKEKKDDEHDSEDIQTTYNELW